MSNLPIFRPELFTALALFAFASSITPGPNNLMLLASGANFGLRRTLPHWGGIVVGFTGLILACGLVLGGLFSAYPVLHETLKWAGAAYLVYLAFKIATSKTLTVAKKTSSRPMTFQGAVAFQTVNVKAWAMALGTTTTYVPTQHYLGNLLVSIVVFVAINPVCMIIWVGGGLVLRQAMERPAVLKIFNFVMAALLIASLYPLFL